MKLLNRWFNIHPNEATPIFWSFLYFFCLLSGYYILRPLRDEMGILAGVENLQWLFTGTFLAMIIIVPIFGFITKRFTYKKFLPYIYAFFIVNIILFYLLFKSGVSTTVLARSFFIWLSVFNLFIVSVFWSFMTDIYSKQQSRRLFGIIAAGGSTGAIAGPILTTTLAKSVGPINLLPVSAIMLIFATICIIKLVKWSEINTSIRTDSSKQLSQPIGGSIFAGIKFILKSNYLLGICGLVFLYTTVSTFLYFEQAHIIDRAIADSSIRTRLFGSIDLVTNFLAITTQLLFTGRLIDRFGMAIILAVIPLLVMIGFFSLSLAAILPIIIIIQVIHRAGNFSLLKPGREMLFTVTKREERYKSKNFIDTTIYRGSDAITGWAFAGLVSFGFSLSAIAVVAIPLAGAWAITGFVMGKKYKRVINDENPIKSYPVTPVVVNLNK